LLVRAFRVLPTQHTRPQPLTPGGTRVTQLRMRRTAAGVARQTGAIGGAVPAAGPQPWFFDVWSLVYDLPLVQRATYRPVHDAVLRTLGARPALRVLDLGCGTGQLAARIKQAHPASDVFGCDFSAGMLSRAAGRCRDVRWIQGNAGRLPFRDRTFDAVTSTEAFHWFPDQDAVLREVYRVLKPGGRLLLAMVNTPAKLVSDAFYVGSRFIGEPFYWPTRSEIRARVEAAGFVVNRQQRVFRLPGFLLLPVLTRAVRPHSRGR
jgi:ubiquinone/menaquinone biosynthesis C-methylase UbiE